MTSSGVTSYEFEVLDFIELGYAYAGLDAQKLGYGHAKRGRQILQAIFGDWQNKHNFPWKLELFTQALTQGTANYTLDASIINILDMVYRPDGGGDIPVARIAESDYLNIPNKSDEGQPDRFWLRRDIPAPTLFIWQTAGNPPGELLFYAATQLYDITASAETLDIAKRWAMATYKRLAYELMPLITPFDKRTAEYQNDRSVLRGEYMDAFESAVEENRDTAPTAIYPAGWNEPGLWGTG